MGRMSVGKAFFLGILLGAGGCLAPQQESVGRIVAMLLGIAMGVAAGITIEDKYDVRSGGVNYRRRGSRR